MLLSYFRVDLTLLFVFYRNSIGSTLFHFYHPNSSPLRVIPRAGEGTLQISDCSSVALVVRIGKHLGAISEQSILIGRMIESNKW
uniref:Putative secreted protein n=1 Tax=Anopheles marajoara TaxID=58244 RepID=A0A2M4CAS6_9DIPT